MTRIPHHVRARIISLGAMSRPLGEERAAALALELARSVVKEFGRSGDAECALGAFELRIRQEIAAKRRRDNSARGGKPAAIPLHELLPEMPCSSPSSRC
jgi:hypothetical protein